MEETTHYLAWNMTRKCNFRCKYCYFAPDTEPIGDGLPPERIAGFLDSTHQRWTVGMTGGEPMIYPRFVEICRELTQNHHIMMDTNLSMSQVVRDLADQVDPAKVVDIYAALHIEERERLGLVESFIENVLRLKEKNFHISVNYVIHPSLSSRYPADRDFFMERGVKLIPRPFKGIYQDRDYPAGYTPEERALFKDKPTAGKKMVINFKGVPCEAGRRLLRLDPDGTVYRCAGDKSILGHILGEVSLYDRAYPCRVGRCPCFGPKYVILDPVQDQFVEGLRHYVIGDRGKACQAFEGVLRRDPDASNALNNMGYLFWEDGRTNQAGDFFLQALQRHPYNKKYVLNAAGYLAAQDRRAEAEQVCGAYLDRYSDRSVETILELVESGQTIQPTGGICVDVVPENTRADIFNPKK